jgi:hypothetical protein
MLVRSNVLLVSYKCQVFACASDRDEDVLGTTCCDWERPGAGRVLIGHSGSRVSVLDLSTAHVASSVLNFEFNVSYPSSWL